MKVRKFTRNGKLAIAAILAGSLLMTACASSSDPSSEPGDDAVTAIRFAVPNTTFNTASAYFSTVPDSLGFFTEEALDVEMIGNAGTSAAVAAILGGQADITIGSTASMYTLAKADDRLRIFSYVAGNVWRVIVPEDSDIRSYEDLSGKVIGVDQLATGAQLTAQAQLDAVGVDVADVEWLAVGMGAQAADAMAKGQVDAYATYLGPAGTVENLSGMAMRELEGPLDEFNGLTAWVTTEEFLSKHADALTGFVRAINKSGLFVNENPSAAVELHWEARPEQKPTSDVDAALKAEVASVVDRWRLEATWDSEGRILTAAEAQMAADFFADHGLMDEPVDVSGMIELVDLEAAADFDQEAIEKLAH